MKFKTLIVALVAMCFAVLAGCASNAPKAISPAQIAAVACPQVNLVHVQLVALNAALVADPATKATGEQATAALAKLHPIVEQVCNGAQAVPSVDLATLQGFAQTALPALAQLVATVPMPPQQQASLQAAIAVATAATSVIEVVQQQVKADVPASAASAAKP